MLGVFLLKNLISCTIKTCDLVFINLMLCKPCASDFMNGYKRFLILRTNLENMQILHIISLSSDNVTLPGYPVDSEGFVYLQ